MAKVYSYGTIDNDPAHDDHGDDAYHYGLTGTTTAISSTTAIT
jgi:hypothetical protein